MAVSLLAACAANLWSPRHPSAVRAAETADAGRFDPELVRPVSGSVLEAALRARAAGDIETARSSALAGLAAASPAEAPALRFIAALAARELGAADEAAALLLPVALSDHGLASWSKLYTAEWLELRDPGTSLALLDFLLVPSSELETWPAKLSAERLRARVLGRLGRRDEALRTFERLLEDSADEGGAIQVLMPMAELLASGDEAERARAAALCAKLSCRVPETRVGKRAEELLNALRPTLPEQVWQTHAERTPEDTLARAEALLKALKYKEALSAFSALEAELPEQQQALRCRARYGRAKTLIEQRARSEGAALMAEVAERCSEDAEQRVWARYHAGRAFSALGKNELAMAEYEALEREAPQHRLADDALFRAAKVARDMGDRAGFGQRLKLLPLRYPQGDMQARARFALALHAASAGDYELAAATLAADSSDEPGEDLQGRAGYFEARFLAAQGRLRQAADAYARTVQRYPLSYYGMSALGRLEQLDAARAQTLAPRLAPGPAATSERLSFAQTPALARPGFTRALALLGVGEAQLALAELRALGFLEPSAEPELTWLCAALLDRAGAPHLAVELVRRRMPELLARAPVGRALALYRLVYPPAYAPLIEDSALRESVPSAFVRAVAREESGFYPKAVSRSGAHGLIQLLESTAKAISKGGMALPTHPAALQEPAINLALGTRFMATLAASVGGQLALVPAAYNAGPAAAARWLAQRSEEPLDLWIENIPFDETRAYSRRVLQTYGIYHWLQTGEVLRLPERLPPRATPPEPVVSDEKPAASLSLRPTLRAGL